MYYNWLLAASIAFLFAEPANKKKKTEKSPIAEKVKTVEKVKIVEKAADTGKPVPEKKALGSDKKAMKKR